MAETASRGSRSRARPDSSAGGTKATVRPGYVAVGVVLTSFGLRGDIKVEALTDFPQRFNPGERVWLAGRERRVERSRWQGKVVYVKLTGIDAPEAVAPLRGEVLEVPESERIDLEAGLYYQSDLIGMQVVTPAGDALGLVVEFVPSGGNDVLLVRGERGEVLIPMIEDVVKQIDVASRRMVIDPIEGLVPEPPRRRSPRLTPGGRTRRPRSKSQSHAGEKPE